MNKPKITIILPDIRSAMNVGAIFRTADAIGAEKIYLTGYTSTPEHPKVGKTAIGAESTVPWEHVTDVKVVIKELKDKGYKVYGLEKTAQSLGIWDAQMDFPLALVVGNEITGVTDDVLGMCDAVVHLPMLGTKESLNVATATGIALYEILRRSQVADS